MSTGHGTTRRYIYQGAAHRPSLAHLKPPRRRRSLLAPSFIGAKVNWKNTELKSHGGLRVPDEKEIDAGNAPRPRSLKGLESFHRTRGSENCDHFNTPFPNLLLDPQNLRTFVRKPQGAGPTNQGRKPRIPSRPTERLERWPALQ